MRACLIPASRVAGMCENRDMTHFLANPLSDRRALVVVALLGFFSGLPLALSGSTLQAWLTVAGVDLKTIGALSLVGWPYLLKFLWAPMLDRWQPLGLGRRRSWLVLTQASLAAVLALCALFDPTQSVWPLVGLALALATLSATQDVAIDAFRTEALTPAARGLGTGYSVAAYRLAMFASGAGALMLADRWGFRVTYLWMAGLMLVGCLVSLIAREPAIPETLRPANREESGLAAPLRQLLGRSRLLPLLLFVVLYKLGDQFAGALAQTFFIRGQGFSLTEIGAIYKGVGIVAALAGGILGGALMLRMSLWRALMVFGALQALTNIGFLVLALGSKSLTGMMLVVMLENFCGGMGTCAHVALIMALCDARYTATQFALLSALASVGRVVLGPIAGLVAGWGWPVFFAVSCGLALPALLLLWSIRPTVEAALPESQP